MAAVPAGVLPTAMALGLLAPATAAAHSPSPSAHREPLPTIEVVDPPPRRLRLIDVRGPLQFGWGWSTLYGTPAYSMSFEASASIVELSETTWLHLTFGESAVLSAVRAPGEDAPGFFGADVGVGLSRYAPHGPAFFLTGTVGPRWATGGPDSLRPHGFGVQGKAEVFPFYITVPEIVDDERGWLRRYVLSGLNVWINGRYDQVLGDRGNAWTGGIGLDLGRSVILPVLMARHRHSRR